VKYDEKIASEMKVVTNYFTIFFSFPGQVFGHFCFLRTNGFDASPSATMAPSALFVCATLRRRLHSSSDVIATQHTAAVAAVAATTSLLLWRHCIAHCKAALPTVQTPLTG